MSSGALEGRRSKGLQSLFSLYMGFEVSIWVVHSCVFLSLQSCCRNPSFGLTTKARARKGASQEWAWESHFMLSRVQNKAREWTPALPSELPLWELESQWTFKSSESDCRSQNSLDSKIPYIIGKLLKHTCLKWACNDLFGYLKHKLWPKEESGIKLKIWLPTTKSQKLPWLICV
jgi:hypothetical protein